MNEEDEAFEDLAKRQGDWGMQGSRKHQILRYAENVESKGTSTTQKEIDILWQKAMQKSIKDGEMFTRYRFAKLIAEAEREACAKVCENIMNDLKNWPSAFEGVTAETKFIHRIGETIAQPFIEAIRARGQA